MVFTKTEGKCIKRDLKGRKSIVPTIVLLGERDRIQSGCKEREAALPFRLAPDRSPTLIPCLVPDHPREF
jgi:hypothetical protein